jgi:MFS family permease
MLDFKIFKTPVYALSSITFITIAMILFSSLLLVPLFSQTVLHLTPLKSGLVMLPGALLNGIMMPISGRIYDKFGAKVLAIPGFAILMVTTYLFSKITLDTTQAHLTVLYAVQMFGVSMIMMPTMTNGLNSLSSDLLPHGTAMNSTLQQVAGAMGTALMITVMTNGASSYVSDHTGKTLAAIRAMPQRDMMQYVKVVMQGSLHGMNIAYTVAFGIAIFGFVFSFFTKRAVVPEGEQRQSGMH